MKDDEPTEFLTLEDILAVGTAYLGRRPQVRDYGILEAAAGRPRAVVFGEPVYPDIHFKAGALLHSVVKGHALVDGNKRLGLGALRLFYALNGYTFTADDDQKFELAMDVAEGRLVAVEDIAARLEKFARSS
ncbi:type II toxin-antitoxin system death-on-curing family toxin [Allobranchiibius sp. CTAmp26]|uniref:type II toxin-antitoxin system death-on-curing family toxin n=1 Tax=Allobranchiibius sp. CTAmp26 TaxID=2815214 RepID=UPI001AA1348E|nr:type II toxin-antitoxin system death-on-curing family toxin [Allobranchiibius sp. CTAmp26]MBO1756353.1 type II toxin-antitoxin system death-on-curing family toxin [Allobranchiibius sp. CTAmp26]